MYSTLKQQVEPFLRHIRETPQRKKKKAAPHKRRLHNTPHTLLGPPPRPVRAQSVKFLHTTVPRAVYASQLAPREPTLLLM